MRVSETRRVFIRRRRERGARGGERVKLMYLFCGHPHMLLAREGSLLSREGLTARRMAETTGPAPRRISAQRYCFCVQRTSVSLPPTLPRPPLHPSPPTPPPPPPLPPIFTLPFHRASRFFEARICAYIAPSYHVAAIRLRSRD